MSWDYRELGEVASITSGGTPSKSNPENWGGEVPWLSAKDLKSFWLRDSIDHITQFAVTDGARLAPKGSILVLVRGMTLMKSLPVGVTTRPVAFNQDIKAIIPDDSVVDSAFLGNYIAANSEQIRARVTIAGHGTGCLPLEALSAFPVPTPSLAEQQKVAGVFGAWDRAIHALESVIAAKTERKRGLMQRLLTGRLRLPGFKGKWQEVKLGKLLKHVFRPVEWAPDATYHLVSIRRRSGGLFRREPLRGDEYKTRDLHEIHEGDFLISKRQVSHGALAMVRKEFHGCHVSKEYTILENRDSARLHMPFFDWSSRTRRMWWLAHVVSSGVALEKLIFLPKDFLKFSIKLPPSLKEQEEIVMVLETCDRELALHRQQLEALRDQKRGLMQKLLTGEVRVKV